MLMRVMAKSPLRRRASRSALVRLSAPNGGGIGRMLVSSVAFLASIVFKHHVSVRLGAWVSS